MNNTPKSKKRTQSTRKLAKAFSQKFFASLEGIGAFTQRAFSNGNYRTSRFWISASIVAIIIFGLYFTMHAKHHKPEPPGLPVVTAIAHQQDVPVYLDAIGTVTATYSVTVKTMINGIMQQVFFREGQIVKTGDLLALIDPRPYEAQLVQYEGQLARDQALLADAKLDLIRYQTLWKQNSVSKQTLDTQVALVQQDEGTVKLDEGLVQGTKLNLVYCNITSPITGRVGLRLVDPGNFVQTSDSTGIAVINMLDPITVIFPIAEDSLQSILAQFNAGKTLSIQAYDRDQNKLLATGTLLAVDSQINTTTGTINLKAQFDNKDNLLYPNQFVNIRVLVNTLNQAVVVPTAAIQHTTQGSFVYLVQDDSTVKVQTVTTSVATGEDTTVTKGLSSGQTVVVEGTDKLTDGAKISVSNDPPPSVKMALSHRSRRSLV